LKLRIEHIIYISQIQRPREWKNGLIVGGQKAKMIGLGGFTAYFITAVRPPSAPEVPNKTGINSASQIQGSRVVGEVPLRVASRAANLANTKPHSETEKPPSMSFNNFILSIVNAKTAMDKA
jgi:hypothetical protein